MIHADSATLFASRPRSLAVRSGVIARNMDNAKNGVVKKKYFSNISTKNVVMDVFLSISQTCGFYHINPKCTNGE